MTTEYDDRSEVKMTIESAVKEGKAAFILGSSRKDNPYAKALRKGVSDDRRHAGLADLGCQWDSGFSIAQREAR